jgi:hypothetical protein
MKKIVFFGMLFSCSNDDEQDLIMYMPDSTLYGDGGKEGHTPPPPPETNVNLP